MNSTIHALRILAMCMWPTVAWAANVTLGQAFGGLTLADVAALVGLASFSGAVALLQRMEREQAAKATPRWIVTHMLTALMAGAFAFVTCEMANIDDWAETLSIMLAAWGGTRYIDKMLDRFIGDRSSPPPTQP